MKTAARLVFLILPLVSTGCMQLDATIKLNEDGSAVVTERVRISRLLVDLNSQANDGVTFEKLLSREAALLRLKQFGKGVQLKEHTLKTLEGGDREAVSVYTAPQLHGLVYMSPFFQTNDYARQNSIKFSLEPVHKSYRRFIRAGHMVVKVERKGQAALHAKSTEAQLKTTPVENQAYRNLGPVFRDLLAGFHVRLGFESYSKIRYASFGVRGSHAGVRRVDLINFSWKDLDRFGSPFLENEECLLDLIRGDFGSKAVTGHLRHFAGNNTIPVYLPYGSPNCWWWPRDVTISFRPSQVLFDQYFMGKILDFGPPRHFGFPRRGGRRPAKFEEIGHRDYEANSGKQAKKTVPGRQVKD